MEPKKTKKERNACLMQALLDMQDDIDMPSKAEVLAKVDQKPVISRDNYLDDYLYEGQSDEPDETIADVMEYDDIEMEDYWI